MARTGLLVATLVAILAVFAALWLREAEPPAPGARETPPLEPPVPEAVESRSALPRVPVRELAVRRGADAGTGYPLQEKFRDQVWSDVPHELVAAHDGRPGEAGEGSRRLFIALVSPALPDADVLRLVRDVRARHVDAASLRIRVFDSREAATRPSFTDGGAARDAHLLADLYREPGRERLLLRGVPVDLEGSGPR